MQHQYWMTKQTISQRFGKKEDECIVSSDAYLDTKLELFRNIESSCALLQKIIDKYQECICYLSQETNSMGRFLKENSETTNHAGEIMLFTGKSLIFCAQQLLFLHEPLMRFYQELETFHQRAIEDTFQNVLVTEKARTEFRATLLWMKNASQQLDPDTSKQLEKFKKVQEQVRRRKKKFDKLSLDCLQKVELLAAARCNMFNYALNFYQNRIINYYKESAKVYAISKNSETKDTVQKFEQFQTETISEDMTKKNRDNFEKLSSSENEVTASQQNTAFQNDEFSNHNVKEEKISEELKNLVFLECDKINYNTLDDNLEDTSAFKIDWNNDDGDTFLPPDILTHSLKTVTNNSETKNNFCEDKNKTKQSQQDGSTKSWLNLFEDLDPLNNHSVEKSNSKSKNSFV